MSNSNKIWDAREAYKLQRANTWSRGDIAVFGGGYDTPGGTNTIDTIIMSTTGNATDFGNLARNTGFVLSTVSIRVAISSPGVSAMFLFGLSGIIGIAIIRISINDTIANESLIKN